MSMRELLLPTSSSQLYNVAVIGIDCKTVRILAQELGWTRPEKDLERAWKLQVGLGRDDCRRFAPRTSALHAYQFMCRVLVISREKERLFCSLSFAQPKTFPTPGYSWNVAFSKLHHSMYCMWSKNCFLLLSGDRPYFLWCVAGLCVVRCFWWLSHPTLLSSHCCSKQVAVGTH